MIASSNQGRPDTVAVNGKLYRWPRKPAVVVCIDGNQPEYFDLALERGLLPNIGRFMKTGFAALSLDAMPSFTNPNNLSIVTGVPPAINGISGNFFLDPETNREVMMNDPQFLRAETILAAFSRHGARVAVVTAKDKLLKLLSQGLRNGIAFSAEKADLCTLEANGIADCLDFVGLPLPGVYSGELSLFVLEAGARLLETSPPELMYLSLTDYIQHKYAPGTPEADAFYQAVDAAVGRLAALGAAVVLTGDHGMRDKSGPDGSPRVIYLQDVLDQALGAGRTRVILPITDPYVAHHGALGSFACVYLTRAADADAATRAVAGLPGIELVLGRDEAAARFELPSDRIGDLVVLSDAGTAMGSRPENHDLSQLGGMRLRSHGGLAESRVWLMRSEPVSARYAGSLKERPPRNFDAFDLALNAAP